MSRWYYTLDNQERLGPVTTEQLRQLALSGTIHPHCMVMPEGGTKWVPAVSVQGLYPSVIQSASPSPSAVPAPSQASQWTAHTVLNLAEWLTLVLAMGLALWAAVLRLAGAGGDLLGYGVACGAILAGLAAVGLSITNRKSMLECAVTALFLAVAGLLFSINAAISASKSKAAADAMAAVAAKEDEARQQREKAEAAEQSAAEMLRKSEEAPARAEATLKQAEEAKARAQEAPQKAARLLEQVKAEQAKLDRKRNELAQQADALAAERAKIEDEKAKVDGRSREVEAARKAADDLAKKAEKDKAHAQELLEQARQKGREAQDLNAKVKEAIEGVKTRLKSKTHQDRKAAIAALTRIGDAAASADYDLCEVVASDPVPDLRRHALDALEKVQPNLHPLVVTLTLPPERNSAVTGYTRAIKQLPTFGRAGLPLLAVQLRGENSQLGKIRHDEIADILRAHAEALSKIAGEYKIALQMLVTMPDSALAASLKPSPFGFYAKVRQDVGNRLAAVGTEKPETRKAIVPYFIGLLKSTDVEARLLAANALGAFGPDAATALPVLRKMNLDSSEQVRKATRDAIAAIEKNDK